MAVDKDTMIGLSHQHLARKRAAHHITRLLGAAVFSAAMLVAVSGHAVAPLPAQGNEPGPGWGLLESPPSTYTVNSRLYRLQLSDRWS
jgi:hypothetical protein